MTEFAPEGDITVSRLTQGDFVSLIPSFMTRGPRGGNKRYRALRVNSGIETIEEVEPGWYQISFMSHRTVIVLLPATLKVRVRVRES